MTEHTHIREIEKAGRRTFLVVQWLGLHTFTAPVQSLVRELKSHIPRGRFVGS